MKHKGNTILYDIHENKDNLKIGFEKLEKKGKAHW